MTLPALLFGFVIATGFGAVFHFWKGGGPGRLVFYLALAWAGFAIGQYLGQVFGLTYARLGPLHLGLASILSLLFLAVGHWLSQDPYKKTGT